MRKIILLITYLLPLTGFGQQSLIYFQKPVVYFAKDYRVSNLAVVKPVCYIAHIRTGNKLVGDSIRSKEVYNMVTMELKKTLPDSVDHNFYLVDSSRQKDLADWLATITLGINKNKEAEKYDFQDDFINMFDTSKVRYIFCTCSLGFDRDTSNYNNHVLGGFLLQITTGFIIYPKLSSSVMACFVIDLKQKKFLYFERNGRRGCYNGEPAEEDLVRMQFHRIGYHYFL